MIEYVRVDSAPEKVSKNEYVVYRPNFLEHIKRAKGRHKENNITTLSNLRNIFIEIGNDYDEAFSAYTHVNLANFVGVGYKNIDELSNLIMKIVEQQIPDAVNKMIENQIKKMPNSVDKIYYVANDLRNTSVFLRYHIVMASGQQKKPSKGINKKGDKAVKELNEALTAGKPEKVETDKVKS